MSQINEEYAEFWMRTWMGRGFFAWLLLPLSLLFKLIVCLRRFAYNRGWLYSKKLDVPVIVVGNIFVGGTGKTPMVIWLVQMLQQAGFHPGVISRGYGTKNDHPIIVSPQSQAEQVGDEPLLIAIRTHCPLVVCKKRIQAGLFLLKNFPDVDVLVCDDGLQHYALQRDIEILIFDSRGGGNQWMLPAGPLREPVTRRGDFTVINGQNYPAPGNPIYVKDLHLMHLNSHLAYRLADHAHTRHLDEFKGTLVAAAGIGNPQRFFTTLSSKGLQFQKMPLADHFDYSTNPFDGVFADAIFITEKDAVKCMQRDMLRKDERIWVVPVDVEMDNLGLQMRLLEMCHEFKTVRSACLSNM